MTRIIGGKAGSLRIQTPGRNTRPTSDRVREAWFSALEARSALAGAHVLDGFGGSGALGLEAASRGAASVVFVENNTVAAQVITANIEALRGALGPDALLRVVTSPVGSFLKKPSQQPYDLVFFDPPYEVTTAEVNAVLDAVASHVAQDGLVMLERSSRSEAPTWPVGFEQEKPKKYGETLLYFASKSTNGSQPPR